MSLAPLALPVMRPRCCLRCLTLRGINMSLVPRSEVRGLVVLTGAALDLLLLGEQALALGVGLGVLFGGRRGPRCAPRLLLPGQAPAATGGDDAAGPGRAARRLAHGHGRL